MMEIKLTVEVLGIPDAINNLAAAIRGQSASVPAVASTPTAPAVTPAPVIQAATPTQTVATPSAPQTPPVNVPTPSNVPTPTPVVPTAAPAPVTPTVAPAPVVPVPAPAQEKKITAEDISRAGAALVDQGKMADVINLLKRYGVQAITQLKEDVYPAFANDLRALGATL